MLLTERQRRRLRADSSAMLGLAVVVALLVFALIAPLVLGDPNLSDFTLARDARGAPPGPSLRHLLGTDRLFRDNLARLAHGARLSLFIALSAVFVAVAAGTLIGLVSGYFAGGRWKRIDDALMRIVDVALAFPYLLLVTAIGVAIDRADVVSVVLILGLTSWTGIARVVRQKAAQLAGREYVLAARALGATGPRIVWRHLLPGVFPTVLILATSSVAQMIIAEAVLGYLTVGIEPPQASWGRMLQEAESYLAVAPLVVAAPGLSILVAALAFTRLGDGLRDAIDPRFARVIVGRRGGLRLLVDGAVVALVAVGLWAGSGAPVAPPGEASASEGPRRGGTLRVATAAAAPRLDPAIAYDEASRAINDLLYARLLAYDDEGRLEPELAESFATEDGGKRFRFVLRAGLTFHDGSPLSAADVKRSLERVLHPKTPCPAPQLYEGIVGFAAYRDNPEAGLAGVAVQDARTVTIQLTQPDVSFLAVMTLGFAAPVCAAAGPFADAKQPPAPCGAGPFRLGAREEGRVVLERFGGFHAPELPYLDAVEWQLGMPATAQRYRFEQGELDVLTELVGIDAFRFARDPRWQEQLVWSDEPTTHFVFLNTRRAPFDEVHLRRAVAFALDPSVLPLVRANIAPAARVVPRGTPGPPGDEPMRVHDRAAALAEMELAGYPYDPDTGRGGYPQPIDYLTIPDSFEQVAAEIFQQQLATVGIRIRLKLVSAATWLTLITDPTATQMGWRGWTADYPDPSTFFAPILTSGAISDEGSQNVSFFSNRELDELVAAAQLETDVDARMRLFERAEEIVRDEAPLVPVYSSRNLHLIQPRVRGYRAHKVVPLYLRDVWLAEDAP